MILKKIFFKFTFGKDRYYLCFWVWLFGLPNLDIKEVILAQPRIKVQGEHKEQYLRYSDKPKVYDENSEDV